MMDTSSAYHNKKGTVITQNPLQSIVQPARQIKQGVDITTIQIDRPLNQLQSSLEFLLCSLSTAFELKAIQSAALLTNNKQYLIAACTKGVKDFMFQPVVNWYETLNYNVDDLCSLIIDEFFSLNDGHTLTKVLDAIASGLHSTCLPVLTLTFQLLTEVMAQF